MSYAAWDSCIKYSACLFKYSKCKFFRLIIFIVKMMWRLQATFSRPRIKILAIKEGRLNPSPLLTVRADFR